MSVSFWFRRLFARKPSAPARRRSPRRRLTLEALEDRTLLNTYFAATAADLIQDINLANAAGGTNTIALTAAPSAPYTLTAVDNSTDGATGLPVIAAGDNLTIVGNGDTIGRSTAAGTPAFRLLDVAAGASLTLEDLILTSGLASGAGVSAQGGAIYSQGALTLSAVTIQNNTARGADGAAGDTGGNGGAGQGGGLYIAGGTVTLNACNLANDTAAGGNGGFGSFFGGDGGHGDGGAIYVAAGPVTLNNCTFANDTAAGGNGANSESISGHGGGGHGGGIFVAGGPVTLTNCTFANDTAAGGNGGYGVGYSGDGGAGYPGEGGAVFLLGGVAVTLNDSTLSNNTAVGGTGGTGTDSTGNGGAGFGGGMMGDFGAPPTLNNTIIAGNSATSHPNLSGSYSSASGSDLLGGDPMLAPLGDYGGPTQTMPPLPGSPAIDAGSNALLPAGLTTDQRGFARISGAAVDIGADEVQEPILSPATLADGTYGAAYSQTLTATEQPGGAGGPYSFAVTAGTLPPGLSLDGTAGTLSGTPTAAGPFSFTITATDGTGFTGSQSYTLTIDKAALFVTATANSKTYGQTASDTGTLSGLVNGDSITASFASAGDAAGASAGSYTISATLTDPNNKLANYTVHEINALLTVSPAALTVTADNQTMPYGGSVPTLTYHYTGLVNGDTSASFTGGLTTTAAGSSGVGSYPITQGNLAATGNYTIGTFHGGTLTVTAAPLSAAAANFSATAGAPFSGAVATFTTADKIDSAAAFSAVITWGDGSTSTGLITGGNGSFTVSGTHTYAAAGSYAVSVQISNPDTQSATANDTAKVTSLNQGVVKGLTGTIGFWQNTGQALIKSFNGGSSATALGNWLATTFPNLYGASAGANNLAGKTNAQVTAFYLSQFALSGTKVEAEVLATALSVYATTSSLGGTAGTAYGFSVSATGLGARTYSVGSDGAAFGVANNTVCDVYKLLQAVNQKSVKGVLYGGNATLRKQATALFDALNQAGSVG